MAKEVKIDTIQHLNEYYGFEHLNPMITVGRYKSDPEPGATTYDFGIYAIYIKETKGCELNYGLTRYDFDEMTVTSFAPAQKVTAVVENGKEQPRWTVLAFHPDFLARTQLGRKMSAYGYFSYSSNEALHLSKDEVELLDAVLSLIEREMKHSIDRHTRSIIISHIEVFLDYCLRFYERQFYTREIINSTVVEKFNDLLDDYVTNEIQKLGLPTVAYFAGRLNLSPGYFGELVRTSTGTTAKDIIAERLVGAARELLNDLTLSVTQIGDRLGFEYPQHFVRFFKRRTGRTPKEYRALSSN
ncbi:AraC family transcriptional regulator [uncultured Duncaniella sp.]|uniref:helix-turn-helix domain-containing protein n=1 Tax=uncultured Duncaniella sp. TaxID=2768039 RepID=UPI002730E54D|nr:AraC family transcriptional regulator [uncultured Duncaniella sp.]